MAIKAPTAPTPPTPPCVPGVTLKDGGTTQETNIPKDKQQTGDEQAEAQARQAVERSPQRHPQRQARVRFGTQRSVHAGKRHEQQERCLHHVGYTVVSLSEHICIERNEKKDQKL